MQLRENTAWMEMEESESGKIIAACIHSSLESDDVYVVDVSKELTWENGRHDARGPRGPGMGTRIQQIKGRSIVL